MADRSDDATKTYRFREDRGDPMSTDHRNAASPNDLAELWASLRRAKPNLRNRDAAAELGVSEAELIASRQDAGNFRLRPDWRALFTQLPKLGRVMALTRNENVVHERHGTYGEASFQHHVGLVLGPDI